MISPLPHIAIRLSASVVSVGIWDVAVRPHNLPGEIHKYLVDIYALARRGLVKDDVTEFTSEVGGAVARDGPVLLEVAFVAHEDEGNRVDFFDAQDLVPDNGELGEGVEGGY